MESTIWAALTGFAVFLPFQSFLAQWHALSVFRFADELFVIICLGFLTGPMVVTRLQCAPRHVLLLLFMLVGVGILSGLVNGNPIHATVLGILDYVKNFLVIPLISVLPWSEKRVKSLYKVLHLLALFLCVVAVLQEISFLVSGPTALLGVTYPIVRFGLLRTPSLTGNPNTFGLHALMFLILRVCTTRRLDWQSLLLTCGIALSVSRMAILGTVLAVLLSVMTIKTKRISRVLVTIALMLLGLLPVVGTHFDREMVWEGGDFRKYALVKSLEIWKANPVLGVGPGCFGGPTSMMYESPVYDQYGFSPRWFAFMSTFNTIDQFWPQVMAEIGTVGLVLFVSLLLGLSRISEQAAHAAHGVFRQRLLAGLAVIPATFMIYFLGSGQNIPAVLLTYGILLAVALPKRDRLPRNRAAVQG